MRYSWGYKTWNFLFSFFLVNYNIRNTKTLQLVHKCIFTCFEVCELEKMVPRGFMDSVAVSHSWGHIHFLWDLKFRGHLNFWGRLYFWGRLPFWGRLHFCLACYQKFQLVAPNSIPMSYHKDFSCLKGICTINMIWP